MNLPIRPYPDHVPTLTEVIEFAPESPGEADEAEAPALLLQPEPKLVGLPASEPLPEAAPAVLLPELSEAQLSQRVLSDVQRQIDSMLEYRLRESMQPLLAQFTETLMQDLREELARTMRDVVTRAVAQEVAKLRNR